MPKNTRMKQKKRIGGPGLVLATSTSTQWAEVMLRNFKEKKYDLVDKWFEKCKRDAASPSMAEKTINAIFYDLLEKFSNSKDPKEKKQILDLVEYKQKEFNPNAFKGGFTFLMHAFSFNAVEFVELFLNKFKEKADPNIPFVIKEKAGILSGTALDCIFQSLVPISTEGKLKLLSLLLSAKPEFSGDHLCSLAFYGLNSENLVLFQSLFAYGIDLFYIAPDNNNFLSAVIRQLTPEPNQKKDGLEDIKMSSNAMEQNSLKKQSEEDVIKILAFLLKAMKENVYSKTGMEAATVSAPTDTATAVVSATAVAKTATKTAAPLESNNSAKLEKMKNLALIEAAALGKEKIIAFLLEQGANPLFVAKLQEGKAFAFKNVLLVSIWQAKFKIACEILKIFKLRSNKENSELVQMLENEALCCAVSTCQSAMVFILLENGAHPTPQNIERTALDIALGILVNKSRDLADSKDITYDANKGRIFVNRGNPLQLSNEKQIQAQKTIVKYLLNKKYKANVNLNPNQNELSDEYLLPLWRAAFISPLLGARDIIQWLLEAGANAELRRNSNGWNIIDFLVFLGNNLELVPIFKHLLSPDFLYGTKNYNGFLSRLIPMASAVDIKNFCTEYQIDVNMPVYYKGNLYSTLGIASSYHPVKEIPGSGNNIEKMKVLMELGADIRQIFYPHTTESEKELNDVWHEKKPEVIVFIYSELLYKLLNLKRAKNISKDPVVMFVNHVSKFSLFVRADGDCWLEYFQSTEPKVPSAVYPKAKCRISKDYFLEKINEAIEKKQKIDLRKILNECLLLDQDIQNTVKQKQIIEKIQEVEATFEECQSNHEHIVDVIGKISQVELGTEYQLKEIDLILKEIETIRKVSGIDDKDFAPDKWALKKQQMNLLRDELDVQKALFNNKLKYYEENHQNNSFLVKLLTELNKITHPEKLDQNKLKRAKEIPAILKSSLLEFNQFLSDRIKLKEKAEKSYVESETLKVTFNNHIATLNKNIQLKEQENKNKQDKERRKNEQKDKANQLVQDILKRRLSNKPTPEQLLAWQKAKAKREKQMAEKFERIKSARAISESLQRSFSGNNQKSTALLMGKPLALTQYLPLPLQAGVDDEFQKLSKAVSELKNIREDISKAISKENLDKQYIEAELKRRALLGLMARIMEHFVQRKLSPMNMDIAQHFRDVVFHGDMFPEISLETLEKAGQCNTAILAMAEILLTFLNSNKAISKSWDEASQAIACPLFHEIISTNIKENKEKSFYLPGIEKENAILEKFEHYKKIGGIYCFLNSAKFIMEHAKGFTYGIRGAHAARLKLHFSAEYNKNKKIYEEYIQMGIQYRHVKESMHATQATISLLADGSSSDVKVATIATAANISTASTATAAAAGGYKP